MNDGDMEDNFEVFDDCDNRVNDYVDYLSLNTDDAMKDHDGLMDTEVVGTVGEDEGGGKTTDQQNPTNIQKTTEKTNQSGDPHDWVSMDVDKFSKSFYDIDENPLSEQIKRLKVKTLMEYLKSQKYNDIIEYARSTDGLINNELRRYIWPILLGHKELGNDMFRRVNGTHQREPGTNGANGTDEPHGACEPHGTRKFKINANKASLFLDDLNLTDIPFHKDEDQVKLDIKRSFTIVNQIQSFSNSSSYANVYSSDEIDYLKRNLYSLIIKLLRKYPSLNYYQGFHDIASIILLVYYDPTANKIDETASFKFLEMLTLNHLRDFMISDISLSLNHLKLIPSLLEIIDYKMFRLIRPLNNGFVCTNGQYYDYNFYQGLSSILTLFSHDIENLNQLLVLWDFSLSYNTVLINIYIYVAAIMVKRALIFESLGISEEDDDQFNQGILDIDKDKLHMLLSSNHLFKNLQDSDLIRILNLAKGYFENYPLDKLSNSSFTFDLWFKQYNCTSVLLNTSTPFEVDGVISGDEREDGVEVGVEGDVDESDRNSDADITTDNSTMKNVPTITPDLEPTELIDNPSKVSQVIHQQNQQMAQLQVHNLSIEKKIFDSQLDESLTTDYDNSETSSSSEPNSLASSLSSLQSSTSSLNTKILKASSMYFKKLLFSDHKYGASNKTPQLNESNNGDKKSSPAPVKWNNVFKLSTIYRISLTVGFIGFLLHFLITKNSNHFLNFNLIGYTNRVLNESLDHLKSSSIASNGFYSGKIGLGNIRNSIYGYLG